ncbi:MAG: hypothetical protein OQJ77_02320 [Thiovulaceae bacterium]|nr:hypothetical protein [Sulfurimonadaceae bacterium]MCW9026128.1 hypothetical protein [Sulfurimonadaceae bacterium]
MKKTIYSLFILLVMIFTACGENTKAPVIADIASIQIDDNNLSIYSTDEAQTLTASVTYTDSTTAQINDADIWNNSDYDVLYMYNGSVSAASNGGSSTVGISYGRFSDEINVSVIKLTDFNISSDDINATGDYILEATGTFEDNTSKVIKTNLVWTADNGAVISVDENYVATITILSGDTNVTATLFEETNTSAPLAPITKTYTVN